MNVRTLFAVSAIVSMVGITGCAGKRSHTSIDSTGAPAAAGQSASVASPATATPAASKESSSGVTDSGITDSSLGAGDRANGRDSADVTGGAANALKTVYFGFDAYILTAEARETLAGNAQYLESNPLTRVTVEGHADERGSDDYNLALAEKRAVAAKRYLQSLGISEERLEAVSFGEDKPAVDGDDEAAWSKNRRVDFVIAK